MAKRSFYVKDSELDDYQVKVINKKTDNSYIVKGCAGSGKSILALWKAKQIQDEHKGTYLYIVFTKALMQYVRSNHLCRCNLLIVAYNILKPCFGILAGIWQTKQRFFEMSRRVESGKHGLNSLHIP